MLDGSLDRNIVARALKHDIDHAVREGINGLDTFRRATGKSRESEVEFVQFDDVFAAATNHTTLAHNVDRLGTANEGHTSGSHEHHHHHHRHHHHHHAQHHNEGTTTTRTEGPVAGTGANPASQPQEPNNLRPSNDPQPNNHEAQNIPGQNVHNIVGGLGGFEVNNGFPGTTFGAKAQVDSVTQGDFQRRAEAIFNRIDTNHTGRMSWQELGNALQSGQFHGQDAQILAALYSRKNDIANLSHDEWFGESGISHQDLERLNSLTTTNHIDDNQANILRVMNMTVERTVKAESVSNMTEHRLFEGPNAITPDAINQGTIGDCYFEAAVASVAQSNPESIRQMIRDNGNGTYTVTFPGDRQHPVTVNAPTEAEMGVFQGASTSGTWPSVLEKAFGEYRQQHRWFRQGYTSAEGGDGGGYSSVTTRLLTGDDTRDDYQPSVSLDQTRDRLTAAMARGQAVTASTGDGYRAGSNAQWTEDGFVLHHAYSIIGFNPNGPDGGTVTVRNPWGTGGDDKRGTHYISLREFRSNFQFVTYQTGDCSS